MQCTSPRTVGYQADGSTLSWSPKNRSKEYATFALPCGKCISCRLEYGRQWAVRCLHESKMHERNSFITLTYDDSHLKSPKLIYEDWQLFMKKLRKTQDAPIGCLVTGEYGDKTKRPHWHALLFNYEPRDGTPIRTTDLGHKVYSSQNLTDLWGKGLTEYGSITLQSASYCARYALKKLTHGFDGSHEYEPISKKSSKHAIGKTYLEKHHLDIFNSGFVLLDQPDGTKVKCPIPRYYEKWLKEKKPEIWLNYVTQKKLVIGAAAAEKAEQENNDYQLNRIERSLSGNFEPEITKNQTRNKIAKKRKKQLEDNLKL